MIDRSPVEFGDIVAALSHRLGGHVAVVFKGAFADQPAPRTDRSLRLPSLPLAALGQGRLSREGTLRRLAGRRGRVVGAGFLGLTGGDTALFATDACHVMLGVQAGDLDSLGAHALAALARHVGDGGPLAVHLAIGPAPFDDQNAPNALEWRTDHLRQGRAILEAAGVSMEFEGFIYRWSQATGLWWEPLLLAGSSRVWGARSDSVASVPVRAIIPAFNESDILPGVLRHLLDSGVSVTVVDNWSTDGTPERIRAIFGSAIEIERFPEVAPISRVQWAAMLRHVEVLAARGGPGWIMVQSADEVRESPWPELTIPAALARVETAGYSAVNQTVMNFRPTSSGWAPESDPLPFFDRFEFSEEHANVTQVNIFRQGADLVDLASSGGHGVQFPGRRVYPWNFLLRHYPIRSAEHGARKILKERTGRWDEQELDDGWHSHHRLNAETRIFEWEEDSLWHFEPDDFATHFLLERLTGMGLVGGDGWNPEPTEPGVRSI